MADIVPDRYCTEHRKELYEVGDPLESTLVCPEGDHEVLEFYITPDGRVPWEVHEMPRKKRWPGCGSRVRGTKDHHYSEKHFEMKFTLPDKAYSLMIQPSCEGEE